MLEAVRRDVRWPRRSLRAAAAVAAGTSELFLQEGRREEAAEELHGVRGVVNVG